MDCAAFWVVGTEIYILDMGLDDRSGAHVAGLERHIQVTVEDVPGGKLSAGFGDTDQLGMERGILTCLAEIVRTGDDLAVFDDDTADRRFAEIVCFSGFFQRGTHEFFVSGKVFDVLVFCQG